MYVTILVKNDPMPATVDFKLFEPGRIAVWAALDVDEPGPLNYQVRAKGRPASLVISQVANKEYRFSDGDLFTAQKLNITLRADSYMKMQLIYSTYAQNHKAKRRKTLEKLNRFVSKVTCDKIELESEKVNMYDAVKKGE